MPFDSNKDSAADPLVSRPRRIPPPLMAAGVAGACVLGAGLGLWARPTNIDNGMATVRPAAVAPARPPTPQQIEIRVDRPPAAAPEPAAEPEAAPAAAADAPRAAPAPAPAPAPVAPKRAPDGLVKVRAVIPAKLADDAPPKAPAETRKAAPAAAAAAAARKKAEAAREAREEAEAAAARKRRQEKARLAAAEAAAREKAEARAREKAERLAEQKAAERLAEKKAAARLAEKKAAEHRLLAEKAAMEKKRVQLAAQRAAKPPAPQITTVKVVKAGSRCNSADPGAALACTDPALGAADRRLARAYREAEEAGVPPERLERQQRRWLQARANAARQAPWAVHDIYLARIAELEDQARAAEGDDY